MSEAAASGAHATTLDALLGGRVAYRQPARGYRVALEAPMLARFAIDGRRRPFEHAVDLGAGPGAIGLMLTCTRWARSATAVELNPEHAALARENAIANALPLAVVHAGVSDLPPIAPAELVIANPPWFEVGDGALAPDPGRAAARAFLRDTLAAFVRVGRALLGSRGRLVITMPAARTTELLSSLAASGLAPKRLRFVHPRPGREAQVAFVEAKPGRAGGLSVERPWCVRGEVGPDYGVETADALWGRWPNPE